MDVYIVLKIFNYRKETSTKLIGVYKTYEGAKTAAHQKLIEYGERMGYNYSDSETEDEDEIYEYEKKGDEDIETTNIDWWTDPPDNCLYQGTYGNGYEKRVFVIVKDSVKG